MTQSLKSIKATAIVTATSSITTSTNIGGNLLPTGNVTYNLGSSDLRWKDLYLSNNTIYLGNTAVSANSILPINLDIAPEVLTINVAAPDPGDDIKWLWNWQTSTLPYARTTIVNSAQVSVPLYKQGTYQINNFANQQTGNMTQRHGAHLKWVDGAGLDNLVSWAVEAGNVSFSDSNINSGASTNVQRINVSVPASITVPTLVAPNISNYMTVTCVNAGVYTFDGNGDGDNRTLGPLYRGGTYTFTLSSSLSGDPFYFTTDNGTNWTVDGYYGEYTTGVTGSRNNGTTGKTTIRIVVDANAPDVLFYQSAKTASKRGAIIIKDLAVETNINGNYVLYFQHTGEGHKTPVEIRPIPSLVNQMCVVYDATVGKFVPQDLATYVENTPSFKNKIREVAGTATLIAPNGVAVVPTVLIVEDTTYLPLINNKDGDIAFDAYYDTIYVWQGNAWRNSKVTSIPGANVSGAVANATYATTSGTAYSVSASNISGTINLSNYATTANSVAGANVSGVVANATYATTSGTSYAVSGSNVSGVVANATYATTSGTSYAVSGSNVSGQVGNALVAGTVYTASQPNITSVGTLTDLSVSGNTIITGNLTVSGTTTTINSTTVSVNDVNIVLANNATNATQANGAGITINGASASMNYISTTNAFTFSHKIVADGSLLTSLTGANVTGYVPNANIANTAYAVAGANVSGTVSLATSATTAGTVTTSAQPNITSVGSLTSLTVTANITAGNIAGGNLLTANYHSGNGSLLTSLTGANVTGYVPNANIANTAYAVAVANITGIGNIATINKDGNASNILYGNGTFAAAPSAGTNYANSNVATFLASYGSNTITTTGNVSVGNIIGNGQALTGLAGANVTGQVGNALVAGTVYTAAQTNITSVGTLTGLTLAANGNITQSGASSQISGGNLVSASYLTGTLTTASQPNITSVGTLTSLTSGTHTISANANIAMSGSLSQISGGNLVSASYITGTLTTAAQPNITSHGALTGLTVSNASGVVDFTTTANVTLGNVSNLHISGGSSGQYLQTNGSGTLVWASASGGGGVTAARSIINSYVFGS